jgi:hypothetical protein
MIIDTFTKECHVMIEEKLSNKIHPTIPLLHIADNKVNLIILKSPNFGNISDILIIKYKMPLRNGKILTNITDPNISISYRKTIILLKLITVMTIM